MSDSSDLTQSSDPLAMPAEIITFENDYSWGMHHLQWHTERQWDRLDSNGRAWAQAQGWTRAKLQEGQTGNGLEFLAMHRVMLTRLKAQFPASASLFNGWTKIPTTPSEDPTAPPVTTPIDSNKLTAIKNLETGLSSFKSDDALGLYIETSMRPTFFNSTARSSDPTTGIHNYLHNRFMVSTSEIDVGDPSKNLKNQLFWRLHGWIDARWTAYRKQMGLSDSDPTYVNAMKIAQQQVPSQKMRDLPVGGPPPASLRHPSLNDK